MPVRRAYQMTRSCRLSRRHRSLALSSLEPGAGWFLRCGQHGVRRPVNFSADQCTRRFVLRPETNRDALALLAVLGLEDAEMKMRAAGEARVSRKSDDRPRFYRLA